MRLRPLSFLLAAAAVATAVGFAADGAPSAVAPKVTPTVVVNGNGEVHSRPAGIFCPGTCKLRVRKGTRVTLTATPDSGSTLSGWTKGCAGASTRCTLKMTRARVAAVTFATPPPPPPPPPPPAKSGHYQGTYSDGTYINLDVGLSGRSVGNISYDENGECPGYGTSYGHGGLPGPYTIQADGSFQGSYSYTFDTGSGTVTISGRFSPDGSASGNLSDTFTFNSGDAAGVTCTSSGTWSARVS